MHCGVPNDAILPVLLVFALFAAVLAVVAERAHFFQCAVRWIQKDPVVRTVLVILLFAIGPITARTKNEQMSHSHPLLQFQVDEPPPEPAIAPVFVWTNGVVLRPESTNSVEITAFRTVGGTELGDWIETAAPFFAVGTNPVARCYVGASGSVSFETMRRPPIGSALPDGTGLPVLCPLRMPLGFIPEAHWAQVFGPDAPGSRFWHDALPGGGRVLTWENALVDRLPGRRVSFQVEMRPSGDSVFRYSFQDELDPPPTNFVMGAQMGTNGVNALSILGTNTLAATVWNVDGAPVTNCVSIADLLCTNGVLRTPATFEIRWKNTTGLDPEADTDNDGLTDWAETFLWGTDPNHADTDGDGIADNIEVLMGQDPFDADVNGDGVPDGTSEVEWLANPLWAGNAGETNLVISLLSAIPADGAATLVVGDLSLPLRSPTDIPLFLPSGEYVPFRLVSRHAGNVALSLDATAPVVRRGHVPDMVRPTGPLWVNDPAGVFYGAAEAGRGALAVPVLHLVDEAGRETETSECVHDPEWSVTRHYTFRAEPEEMGLTTADLSVEEFAVEGPHSLSLTLEGDYPAEVTGTISVLPAKLRRGLLATSRTLHRCEGAAHYHDCHACGFPHDPYDPCSHAPDCAAVLDPAADCSCDLWLQVAWQDADGNGIEDRHDANLVAGSATLGFRAMGSTRYSCCCGLETGEDALTARLVSHSPNLRLWDESGDRLHSGDELGFFTIQATAPSLSVGGSEVVYRIVGPTNDVRRTISLHVTAWDMWCTGVAFNHAPNAHATDAINLRHGYADGLAIDYSLPEWTRPADHAASPTRNEPACWIAGTTPEIKGRFVVSPTDITNAVLCAGHGGTILAGVPGTAAAFSNGVTRANGTGTFPDFATFALESPVPAVVSRSTEEEWVWYATELNGHPAGGLVAATGPSVAYSILGAPVAPWSNVPGTNANAWTSALDIVCSNGWASGAMTLNDIGKQVSDAIFDSNCFVYDVTNGATRLMSDHGRFLLSDTISNIRNHNVSRVNCSDCARLTTSLANLAGCSLYSSRMGFHFTINPICAIGCPPWTPPNWGPGFSYHEVAWSGHCEDKDIVFDACLKLDGDEDPSSAPHTAEHASNIVFSDGNSGPPLVYRERLCPPGSNGYDRCIARPYLKRRFGIE